VVDGFGPIGTDGAFVITAQSTAKVLRDNANSLITILSAVVSDPLYSWNVNPVKAKQRGDENTSIFSKEFSQQQFSDYGVPEIAMMPENDNEAARRAITKVSAKLKGYEEGTSGERQSVEGQVQLLINAARDPNKLCMIYHGWMPWL
jgi:ataxia telangiectasia mutated family protein